MVKKRTKRLFLGSPRKVRRKLWFVKALYRLGVNLVFAPFYVTAVGIKLFLIVRDGWDYLILKSGAFRNGNPVSRMGRVIFEGRFIRTVIGTAVLVVFILNTMVQESIGGSYGFSNTTPSPTRVISTPEEQGLIVTQKGVQIPLAGFKVNQSFRKYHPGADLDGDMGDIVRPVSSGKVELVEKSWVGYGNHVVVDHGAEFKSLYGHLSKIDVVNGQDVGQDTKLGEVGSTGWSSGPHLHLEFWVNGVKVDPLIYLR